MPKRKRTVDVTLSTFIGNRAFHWNPRGQDLPPSTRHEAHGSLPSTTQGIQGPLPSTTQTSDSQMLALTELPEEELDALARDVGDLIPSNPDERKACYKEYLIRKLQELDAASDNPESTYFPSDKTSQTERADRKAGYLVLLSIFHHTGRVPYGVLDMANPDQFDSLEGHLNHGIRGPLQEVAVLREVWSKNKRGSAATVQDSNQKVSRSTLDKKAQESVPAWYDGRCTLTHDKPVQGSHIVAVGVETHPRLADFWTALEIFWRQTEVREWRECLEARGHEEVNILPLSVKAHYLWGRLQFAIRPVRDPKNPTTELYLQLVWLNSFDPDKGVNTTCDGSEGSLTDWRKEAVTVDGNGKKFRRTMESGDVVKLITTDPKNRRLPHFGLLNLQYHLHRILFLLKAAESLELIFRGPPPDVDPVKAQLEGEEALVVPDDWAEMIQDAQDLGILDKDAALRWGLGFALMAKQRRQEREDQLAALREQMEGWGSDYGYEEEDVSDA